MIVGYICALLFGAIAGGVGALYLVKTKAALQEALGLAPKL